jgi:hypothetical protein
MEEEVLYIARTPDPVYWSAGWHKDSELHAIASARGNHGGSGDVYLVYQGSVGTEVNGMGQFMWPKGKSKPELLACYDAAGNYLGETLKDVAKKASNGEYSGHTLCWDNCLSDKTINELKRYAKEHK